MSRFFFALIIVASGVWVSACGRSPSRPSFSPVPIQPVADSVLDNGRIDLTDGLTWAFTWSEVPNADRYELYVRNADASNPVLDADTLTATSFRFQRLGYVFGPHWLTGWSFRVRAEVDGSWGPWSRPREFKVEPRDTDRPPDAVPVPLLPDPGHRPIPDRASNGG